MMSVVASAVAMEARDAGFEHIGTTTINYFDMYGPVIIGSFVGCFAWSAFLVLAYLYFRLYPTDSRSSKILVVTLICLTTGTTLAGFIRVMKVAVIHPGDRVFYLDIKDRKEVWISRLFAGLTCNICGGFMLIRIVKFAQSFRMTRGKMYRVFVWGLTVVLAILWVFSVACGLSVPIYLATLDSYTQLEWQGNGVKGLFTILTDLQVGSFLAVDVAITVCMTTMLHSARSGFAASDKVIDSLIYIVLKTGGLATCIQLAQALTYNLTTTTWGECFPMFIGQMFSASVLAVLMDPRQIHIRYFNQQLAPTESISMEPTSRGMGLETEKSLRGMGKSRTLDSHAGCLMTFQAALASADEESEIETLPVVLHTPGATYDFGEETMAEASARPLSAGTLAISDDNKDDDTVSMNEVLGADVFW